MDEHSSGHPKTVEVLSQNAAITIPDGPHYSHNYVTGMGVDFTVAGAVHHPNPEKEVGS